MNRFLIAWVRGVRQRAGSVLVAIGVVTLALGVYAATHLGINTHHTAVLDSGLPFWEDYNAFGRVFPILDGYDISTPEKLDRAVQSRNALVNRNLKKLALLARIKPGVSFHMSRHSFADLALQSGWGVRKIQSALGHKDVQTTENYLKDFDPEFIGQELSELFPGSK